MDRSTGASHRGAWGIFAGFVFLALGGSLYVWASNLICGCLANGYCSCGFDVSVFEALLAALTIAGIVAVAAGTFLKFSDAKSWRLGARTE